MFFGLHPLPKRLIYRFKLRQTSRTGENYKPLDVKVLLKAIEKTEWLHVCAWGIFVPNANVAASGSSLMLTIRSLFSVVGDCFPRTLLFTRRCGEQLFKFVVILD